MKAGEAAVRVEGLTKYYGRQRGIIDLTMVVPRGQVFGFLGPNGAGKTTTIRVLMDFIRATSGRAEIFGLDSQSHSVEIRRRTGYLPGDVSLYNDLTGMELLRYFGGLRGSLDRAYVKELARRLDCDLSRPVRTLSHGNRQKVGLLQAFVHRPELLILDEPTGGLDPLVRQEFYSLIAETRAEGKTVLFSSHILPEVERVCDSVAMVREGRLLAVEEVGTLKSRAVRRLEIHFAEPVPPEAFRDLCGIKDAEVSGKVLTCTAAGNLDALVKAAARFEVVTLSSQEPSLEDVFLLYYSNAERADAA